MSIFKKQGQYLQSFLIVSSISYWPVAYANYLCQHRQAPCPKCTFSANAFAIATLQANCRYSHPRSVRLKYKCDMNELLTTCVQWLRRQACKFEPIRMVDWCAASSFAPNAEGHVINRSQNRRARVSSSSSAVAAHYCAHGWVHTRSVYRMSFSVGAMAEGDPAGGIIRAVFPSA